MDCGDVEFAVSDWLTDIRANPNPAINAEPALGFRFPVFAQDYACHACETSLPPASHVQCLTRILRFRAGTYLLCGKRRITCPLRPEEVVTDSRFISFPLMRVQLVLNACGRNKSPLPSSLSVTLSSSLRVLLHSHALNSLNERARASLFVLNNWATEIYLLESSIN